MRATYDPNYDNSNSKNKNTNRNIQSTVHFSEIYKKKERHKRLNQTCLRCLAQVQYKNKFSVSDHSAYGQRYKNNVLT